MEMKLENALDLIGMSDVSQESIDYFNSCDFTYEKIDDVLNELLEALKFIDNDTRNTEVGNLELWVKSWGRNFDLEESIPFHYDSKKFTYVLDDEFVKFNDKNAEVNFCNFLSTCLFTKYFSEVDNIYEFGSGSGVNLQRLSETFPTKNLFGLDFSQNAIKSLNNFAKINNLNIKSSYFDLINPDISMEIKPNSAVFTEFALEQTSNKFHEFILFLLKRKPEICIHIEPMPELIKDETFSDYLSKKFNSKRNYLNGLVPFLKSLENTGLIEILDLKRVKWKRSTGTECLNYLVWKVK